MPHWAQVSASQKPSVSRPVDPVIVFWPSTCCVHFSSRIINQFFVLEILLQVAIIGIQ